MVNCSVVTRPPSCGRSRPAAAAALRHAAAAALRPAAEAALRPLAESCFLATILFPIFWRIWHGVFPRSNTGEYPCIFVPFYLRIPLEILWPILAILAPLVVLIYQVSADYILGLKDK